MRIQWLSQWRMVLLLLCSVNQMHITQSFFVNKNRSFVVQLARISAVATTTTRTGRQEPLTSARISHPSFARLSHPSFASRAATTVLSASKTASSASDGRKTAANRSSPSSRKSTAQGQKMVASNSTETGIISSTSDDSSTITTTTATISESPEEIKKIKDTKFLERNKRWVVLVDDEEAIRLSVGDYLYDQGYQVAACADVDAFFELLEQQGDSSSRRVPDVIISDIRMPGKDGLDLLHMIRADDRLARVPVVLLTAKAMTQDRIAGYKAGANVYLPKPFFPEELLSIVDNSIVRRKQMAAGNKGALVDIQHDMAQIKELMRQNTERVVQKTTVYLSLAERQVLELLCQGYTNKEIAEERGISADGVNRMIQKLYAQTETETRTELVAWAMKTGYVSKR